MYRNNDPENPAGKIEDSKLSSSLKLVPLKKSFSKELFVICGVVIRTIRLIVLELLIKRIRKTWLNWRYNMKGLIGMSNFMKEFFRAFIRKFYYSQYDYSSTKTQNNIPFHLFIQQKLIDSKDSATFRFILHNAIGLIQIYV
ncbi:hypothetical protein C1645_817036 [Glomus cerebriforme]|uniref:Uncharacterized protein n=1 Tax=Glomus cerebriforme TaxID=658196 RepID=A0A397TA96_9GLOM|nr:hypothetical protein C1645_817036 [Glomus cerebriforme]